MSTPKKENEKTSDPVLQSSGEVLKEVVKEKLEEDFEEPTLQGIVNLLTMMNTKFDAKFNALENRMAVLEARWSPKYSRGGTLEPNKEVLALPTAKPEEGARTSLFGDVEDSLAVLPQKTPLAVQEALMSPSRSRAPGQELKTAVSGVEVAKRTSSFEGSVSSEEERSQVETRSDDEDSQTLPTARIKLSPSLGHEIRVSHDEGDNLIVPDFLHEHPAKKPTVKDNPDRELAKEDASERASLFEDFGSLENSTSEDSSTVKVQLPMKTDSVNKGEFSLVQSVSKVSSHSPPEQEKIPKEGKMKTPVSGELESDDDPVLMKKSEPPDIGEVMEPVSVTFEEVRKPPPRRLVRRESISRREGGMKRSSVRARCLST